MNKSVTEYYNRVIQECRGYVSSLELGSSDAPLSRMLKGIVPTRIIVDTCRKALENAVNLDPGLIAINQSIISYDIECIDWIWTESLVNKPDVIILLDIIEHFPKWPANAIINGCKLSCNKKVIIFCPVGEVPSTPPPQYDTMLNRSYWEHRSEWYKEDLESLGFKTDIWSGFHEHLRNNKNGGDVLFGIFAK